MSSEQLLARPVHIGGESKPFGELSVDEVRTRADELRDAVGFGPTARVAPVARAWRELSMEMVKRGAATVADLDPALVAERAGPLWIKPPV